MHHKLSKFEKLISIFLGVALIITIAAILYVIITPNGKAGFSEFYILGSDGLAEDYPQTLIVGEQRKIILGIINKERETTSYRVVLWQDNELLNIWLDGEELAEIETGPLVHDEKWRQEIGFTVVEPTVSAVLRIPAIQGSVLLGVAMTDNLGVNDYIQIGYSAGEPVEFAQITSIDNTNSEMTIITINTPLEYNHDEGEMILQKPKVEFWLFKNDDNEPYLTLRLYMDILSGPSP